MKKGDPIHNPSLPLVNKKYEQFCQLYAYEHWGNPIPAAAEAGMPGTKNKIRFLMGRQDVRDRIRYLRRKIAEETVADEAWIKEHFIEIVNGADKNADRLRALISLYRTVTGRDKGESSGQTNEKELPDLEFEGSDDI